MKLYQLLAATILGLLSFNASSAAALTCEEAIVSTCKHYSIGDGATDRTYTCRSNENFTWCHVRNADSGVNCTFETGQCPIPAPAGGGDPHDIPDVVYCNGCDGSAPYSINEAKCCLAYGQPTNPSTGHPHC